MRHAGGTWSFPFPSPPTPFAPVPLAHLMWRVGPCLKASPRFSATFSHSFLEGVGLRWEKKEASFVYGKWEGNGGDGMEGMEGRTHTHIHTHIHTHSYTHTHADPPAEAVDDAALHAPVAPHTHAPLGELLLQQLLDVLDCVLLLLQHLIPGGMHGACVLGGEGLREEGIGGVYEGGEHSVLRA